MLAPCSRQAVHSTMSTSWRPSLKPMSFYPPSNAGELCAQRTIRVWGPKKSANDTVPAERDAESVARSSHVYATEELLLLRQRMIDAGSLGEMAAGKGDLKCLPLQTSEVSRKSSKKLST